MHPALKLVTEHLSCPRERAELLFMCDEDFRELCEEYCACCDTVSRLEGTGRNDGLRLEYLALRLRVERELRRHLGQDPES
jgi:hypothetical protein